ncbi:hypothetical protein K0038_02234 [Pseudomonas syringae]|nr:hypothetical protein [Pseudomonas syringae]
MNLDALFIRFIPDHLKTGSPQRLAHGLTNTDALRGIIVECAEGNHQRATFNHTLDILPVIEAVAMIMAFWRFTISLGNVRITV